MYNVDESDHMNGMRVKLTWSLSGGGTCAPLLVTATGLNERELPSGDMLVVQVAGLCIGGSGVGANEQEGYIVFTRSGQDQKRFEFYQSNVLLPFINSLRKEYSIFDISDGISIPDELTAAAWCDGDLPQVHAIVGNHNLFTEMKVVANKQNAARTGVEQPADLAKVFIIFKQQNKTHTVTDIDPPRHPMKMRVTRAFNSDALKVLNLNSKKKSSLIDFISTLPELATKAATRGNILHGFYESGLIDRTKSRYPVLLKVIGTCRSTLPKEVYQSVIDNFTHLYRTMMEHGRIPEDVFDGLGFPRDKDVYGHEVLRAAGISQESYQRSKCLTHEFQIDLRKERIERIENDQRHKADQMQQKRNEEVHSIGLIEEKLLNMIAENSEVIERSLDQCTIDMC